MEQHIDVLVIGAGSAGSAAALQLGRVRRSVVVIDAGAPRNAPAAHMQGYLGHDGRAPTDFLEIAHRELETYGVSVISGRVESVVDDGDTLLCTSASGDVHRARRIVLATGLTDLLPPIDGVRELWGDRVVHCPWCHGWEVRDQRIAVIDTSGFGAHQALVFAQLSDRVTLIRNARPDLTDDEAERLRLAGVAVELRRATGVAVCGGDVEIRLDDGVLVVDAVAVMPHFEPNVAPLEGLVEVVDHVSGLGRQVVVDETGATSHPKVYAAGNVTDPMQQVLHAAAHGSRIATMLNVGLIDDDIELARRSAAGRAEWNDRYGERGGQRWSGRPNGSLVVEASRLAPGRALDVGCGEGADAIWLAQQGWQVTATDISTVAIDRARAAAAATGVDVAFEATDVVADPPPARAFDLVAVSYPAIERDHGLRAYRSIAGAVSPAGRLVMIGHVLDEHGAARAAEHGFDPDAHVSFEDLIEIIAADFVIECDEERERPDAPAGAHHSRDRVLVARRIA